MLSVELQFVQKKKNVKARDNRSKYRFKSAHHLLFTSTEAAGLKTVAVFTNLGSFPCEFPAALLLWELAGKHKRIPCVSGPFHEGQVVSALLGASLDL